MYMAIDQEKKQRYQEIAKNNDAAENDPSKVLAERAEAQLSAEREVIGEAIRIASEGGHDVSDEQKAAIERAVKVAVGYLYQTGNPDFNADDIRKHLDVHFGWQQKAEADSPQKSWRPETDQELAQVVGMVQLASDIGSRDARPAFIPAREEAGGRRHEILDDQDYTYNKYGFHITHGMQVSAAVGRVDPPES